MIAQNQSTTEEIVEMLVRGALESLDRCIDSCNPHTLVMCVMMEAGLTDQKLYAPMYAEAVRRLHPIIKEKAQQTEETASKEETTFMRPVSMVDWAARAAARIEDNAPVIEIPCPEPIKKPVILEGGQYAFGDIVEA
jgi:hypothetical protein